MSITPKVGVIAFSPFSTPTSSKDLYKQPRVIVDQCTAWEDSRHMYEIGHVLVRKDAEPVFFTKPTTLEINGKMCSCGKYVLLHR